LLETELEESRKVKKKRNKMKKGKRIIKRKITMFPRRRKPIFR